MSNLIDVIDDNNSNFNLSKQDDFLFYSGRSLS